MPQVPNYSPVPEVTPQFVPTPNRRADTPLDAFGGGIAAATSHLGQALETSGNELFTRAIALQQLNNESAAHNIVISQSAKLGQARDEYLQTSGINAQSALPKYQSDLQGIRQDALKLAPNPMVGRMVDNEISSRIVRDSDYGGLHAATEFKRYNVETSKGMTSLYVQNAAGIGADDAQWNKTVNDLTASNRTTAALEGWPKPYRQSQLNEALAAAATKRAESLALTRPFDAMRLYQKDPSVYGANQVGVQKFIQGQINSNGAKQLVDGVVSSIGYDQKVFQKESSGNISSKASTSSASGLAGFTQPTWSDVRKNHPELNLPPTVSQATAVQQKAALDAFTGDNSKVLAQAGIPTNEANLYLAHFLGAEGAKRFYTGMKADPGASAASYADPASVAANRSIFFHEDGSPRSAAETYMKLTSTFGGPGPLTKDSDSTWLSRAQKVVSDAAEPFSDFAPGLKSAALSRVQTAYGQVHSAAVQADRQTQNSIETLVLGNGNVANRITDMSQITGSPVLQEQYNQLPAARQVEIQNLVKKMAMMDVPFTPERQRLFNQVHGMFLNPATRDQAFSVDLSKLDLPQKQINQLNNERGKIVADLSSSERLRGAIGLAGPYMKSLNLARGSDEENEFIGALHEKLTEYETQHKAYPDEKVVREMAADLAAYNSTGWFSGRYGYEPTSEFKSEIAPLYKAKKGRDPNPGEMSMMYQYSLTHPNWRQELK